MLNYYSDCNNHKSQEVIIVWYMNTYLFIISSTTKESASQTSVIHCMLQLY